LLVELGGWDAIIFTGGIGENGVRVRAGVCAGLEEFGLQLDSQRNETAQGEAAIHAETSRVQAWIIPTNEELVVARQARQLLEG
jgi:acetate kinase